MGGAEAALDREAAGSNLFRWLRGQFYRFRGPTLGIREALFWSAALDTWHRYAALMEVLEERLFPGARILEIGPGWSGLEFFLPFGFTRRGFLIQLDIRSRPLLHVENEGMRVRGSGLALPGRPGAFDFVVAMDVLEHIPRTLRDAFASEVRRVTQRAAFLHMPLESEDGIYAGARSDEAFQRWYESRFGGPEPNIQEHLAAGHPTLRELQAQFPGVEVRPTQGVRDWLWYMKAERMVAGPALAGLIAYLRGSRGGPPFYSGLGVWVAV